MDFGALPPEVNSACMYAGAGAAPMLAAAAAWNGVAGELRTAAFSFAAVIARLSTEEWVSSASLSMAAAAQPFVAWMAATAESSARAAAQAMSSVAAYEAAFAMTVPPAAVAANRAQLALLTETNILGQNTPAIAVTEARYSEMWARDAAAMYGYAASSAAAAQLDPLIGPSEITNPAGVANQAAAVAQAIASGSASAQQAALGTVVSQGPDAVLSLAGPAEASAATGSPLLDMIVAFDRSELWWAGTFDHNRATYWDYSVGQIGSGGDDDDAPKEIVHAAAHHGGAAHSARSGVAGPTPVVAGLGNAHLVGELSVPLTWSDSVPATPAAPAVDGTYWAVPANEEAAEELPLAPGSVAAIFSGRTVPGPRYGVKPVVMPRQRVF
ncbi:MAG: PPE family protein [Mycobacterium gordonae]|nr:PPE family protein [Mycobacterium gordonae]